MIDSSGFMLQRLSLSLLLFLLSASAFANYCDGLLTDKGQNLDRLPVVIAYKELVLSAKDLISEGDLKAIVEKGDPFALSADGQSQRLHIIEALKQIQSAAEAEPASDLVRSQLISFARETYLRRTGRAAELDEVREDRAELGPVTERLFKDPNSIRYIRRLVPIGDGDTFAGLWSATRGASSNPCALRVFSKSAINLAHHELPRTFDLSYYFISAMPDQRRVLLSTFREVHIQNVETGQSTYLFRLPIDTIIRSAIPAKMKPLVAVATEAGPIYIVNYETNKYVTAAGRDLSRGDIVFSQDEQSVIAVSNDGLVNRYSSVTGERLDQPGKTAELGPVQLPKDVYGFFALSPDGQLLLEYFTSGYLGVRRLADLSVMDEYNFGKLNLKPSLQFSPDGRFAVVERGHEVFVLKLDGKTDPIHMTFPESFSDAVFSEDSKSLILTEKGGPVTKYDLRGLFLIED